MADLRTRIEICSDVDANGDASVRRVWHLTNLSEEPLDLTKFRFFVAITSQDIPVQSLTDNSGTQLSVSTEAVSPEKTRINCDFDVVLQPKQSYDLILHYNHPRYLTRFIKSEAWLFAEYFQRQGPLTEVNLTEEEPQTVSYTITLTDPRPGLLGIRNPIRSWTTEVTQQCREQRFRDKRTITYECGLRPLDRSADLHILSLVSYRSLIAAAFVFAATTILSAGATWAIVAALGP